MFTKSIFSKLNSNIFSFNHTNNVFKNKIGEKKVDPKYQLVFGPWLVLNTYTLSKKNLR